MYHAVSGLKYAWRLITNTFGILDFERQDEIMPEMKERIPYRNHHVILINITKYHNLSLNRPVSWFTS